MVTARCPRCKGLLHLDAATDDMPNALRAHVGDVVVRLTVNRLDLLRHVRSCYAGGDDGEPVPAMGEAV